MTHTDHWSVRMLGNLITNSVLLAGQQRIIEGGERMSGIKSGGGDFFAALGQLR